MAAAVFPRPFPLLLEAGMEPAVAGADDCFLVPQARLAYAARTVECDSWIGHVKFHIKKSEKPNQTVEADKRDWQKHGNLIMFAAPRLARINTHTHTNTHTHNGENKK